MSDVHAPLRSKRVGSSKSLWITAKLKNMMHFRDRLKIKAIRSGDPNDWNDKRVRNNANNAIKNAKKSYYLKSFTACDGNSRKTWEIINEVTGRKSEKAIINELEFERKKLTDPTEIAEGLINSLPKSVPRCPRILETLILVSMNLSINLSRAALVFNK